MPASYCHKTKTLSDKILNTSIIGIGQAGLNAMEYFNRAAMLHIDLFMYSLAQGAVLKYPFLATTSFCKINKSALDMTSDVATRKPAVAFLVASATETASLDMLKSCSSDLQANGIFTIALITFPPSYTDFEACESISVAKSLFHLAADSVIILPNLISDKTFSEPKAAESLRQITDNLNAIINENSSEINIDFKDIQSVLSGKVTLAGMGTAQGVNRAAEAIRQALSPPSMLLNAIAEAKEILLIIQSGPEADLEMAELTSITEIICEKANKKAEVLFGHLTVANLGTSLKILVLVATDEY